MRKIRITSYNVCSTKLLRTELEVTRQEYDALKKGAANYLGLQEAHEKLASELPELKAKLAEAQKVHDKLQSSANMRWFLYGAGTIVLGWIFRITSYNVCYTKLLREHRRPLPACSHPPSTIGFSHGLAVSA